MTELKQGTTQCGVSNRTGNHEPCKEQAGNLLYGRQDNHKGLP